MMSNDKSACSVCFASGIELGKSCAAIKAALSRGDMPPVVDVVEMIAAFGAAVPCEVNVLTTRPYLRTFMLAYDEKDVDRMTVALEDIMADMTFSEIARAAV